MSKSGVAISKQTRWKDGKGREWQVIENLFFGRYICTLVGQPSYSGEWTAKEIRAAIDKGFAVTA